MTANTRGRGFKSTLCLPLWMKASAVFIIVRTEREIRLRDRKYRLWTERLQEEGKEERQEKESVREGVRMRGRRDREMERGERERERERERESGRKEEEWKKFYSSVDMSRLVLSPLSSNCHYHTHTQPQRRR